MHWKAWPEDPESNSFVIDVAALNGSQWAELIRFFIFYFFSCLAVRPSHSHPPGGMTVSHPIIPLNTIVLFYVLYVPLISSLNACCTSDVLLWMIKPDFVFALTDRDRESWNPEFLESIMLQIFLTFPLLFCLPRKLSCYSPYAAIY